jgi:hypothetical protein
MPFAPRGSIAGRHALPANLAANKWSFFRFQRRLNNKAFERANGAVRALWACAIHARKEWLAFAVKSTLEFAPRMTEVARLV